MRTDGYSVRADKDTTSLNESSASILNELYETFHAYQFQHFAEIYLAQSWLRLLYPSQILSHLQIHLKMPLHIQAVF